MRVESENSKAASLPAAGPREYRFRPGQRMGKTALRARQRILDAISSLLRTKPPWQLKANDVAVRCEISQSNFYTYFASIDDALHALALQVHERHPDLAPYLAFDWTSPAALDHARALARAAIGFWKENRPILRLTQTLAEDGDPEYLRIRLLPHGEFFDRCTEMVLAAQAEGRLSTLQDPRLTAYTAFGALESYAATIHLHEPSGFTEERSIDTIAANLVHMLTGRVAEQV